MPADSARNRRMVLPILLLSLLHVSSLLAQSPVAEAVTFGPPQSKAEVGEAYDLQGALARWAATHVKVPPGAKEAGLYVSIRVQIRPGDELGVLKVEDAALKRHGLRTAVARAYSAPSLGSSSPQTSIYRRTVVAVGSATGVMAARDELVRQQGWMVVPFVRVRLHLQLDGGAKLKGGRYESASWYAAGRDHHGYEQAALVAGQLRMRWQEMRFGASADPTLAWERLTSKFTESLAWLRAHPGAEFSVTLRLIMTGEADGLRFPMESVLESDQLYHVSGGDVPIGLAGGLSR